MNSFDLTIVCPDGCIYDGPAELIMVRTTQGEVGIMAHHQSYTAALGMGPCTVVMGEQKKKAACIGGMIEVSNNKVSVIATTFEWKEDLDLERAKNTLAQAQEHLAAPDLSKAERLIWDAQRRRALVRISVAQSE